jgi:hydrogenase maturation protease
VTTGPLVVGYGNALRSDDGLGWHAAELLARDPRLERAVVLQRHQLTPELALDLSAASVVVLVDACKGPVAGAVTVQRVEAASHESGWSHTIGAATLVALSQELYGDTPDVFVVSCAAQSFDAGSALTPAVEAALPRVVDAVAGLVAAVDRAETLEPRHA